MDFIFENRNWGPFMASFYASMGTFLGGAITIVLVKLLKADPSAEKTRSLIGVMQSFAAGVMIFMTCFHLIPESTETIGSHETMIYFFVGVLCFVVLDRFIIPEDHGHDHGDDQTSKVEEKSRAKGKGKETTTVKEVKLVDLWSLHRTSVITFVAMALHNIPEGISVYLAVLSNQSMGYKLAAAILLHNIPEGMAVGIPLYASTGSIIKVLWWTFVNGLAEPFGVVIAGLFLAPYLDSFILSRCLAAVGGIMFSISIHELYPVAIKLSNRNIASYSLLFGMGLCYAILEGIDMYFGHVHHGHSHTHGPTGNHDHEGHDHYGHHH